jgi:opacity protein-like surface antigen
MQHYRNVTRRLLAAAALGFVAATAVLAAAPATPDISGTWTTKFESQVGEQSYTYTFKVEGGKLTGHAKSNLGEGPLADGKVDKDTVTFVEHLDYQGQALQISYQGKIVSADEISFKRDVAGQGGEEFVAKREKK